MIFFLKFFSYNKCIFYIKKIAYLMFFLCTCIMHYAHRKCFIFLVDKVSSCGDGKCVHFFICAVYIVRHSRGWPRLNRLAFVQAPCALFIAILNEKSIQWVQYDNILIYIIHVYCILFVLLSRRLRHLKNVYNIYYMIIVPCTMKYYLLLVFVSNWTIIMVGYFFSYPPAPV